jgi:hypothetical protein
MRRTRSFAGAEVPYKAQATSESSSFDAREASTPCHAGQETACYFDSKVK